MRQGIAFLGWQILSVALCTDSTRLVNKICNTMNVINHFSDWLLKIYPVLEVKNILVPKNPNKYGTKDALYMIIRIKFENGLGQSNLVRKFTVGLKVKDIKLRECLKNGLLLKIIGLLRLTISGKRTPGEKNS